MSESDSRSTPHTASDKKKPYKSPKLTEYGSVSKLTMSKGSTTVEIVPNAKKGCL